MNDLSTLVISQSNCWFFFFLNYSYWNFFFDRCFKTSTKLYSSKVTIWRFWLKHCCCFLNGTDCGYSWFFGRLSLRRIKKQTAVINRRKYKCILKRNETLTWRGSILWIISWPNHSKDQSEIGVYFCICLLG